MTRKEIIDRLREVSAEIDSGICFAGRHLPNFDDYREGFDEAYTNVDDLTLTLLREKNLAENGYQLVEPEYSNVLSQLELWTEELAKRGPGALPEIYREMYRFVTPLQARAESGEPCIDFDYQKGYK
ncbi:MAG TPA: hypothetical protein DCS60_06020 [Opitutae bacterium]|nr:hypothetical protein [Opitutae bacterium]|tara:strand:- start:208 stop:588 length:381 start_codon:yes stop_codon:yes gene_type:complete